MTGNIFLLMRPAMRRILARSNGHFVHFLGNARPGFTSPINFFRVMRRTARGFPFFFSSILSEVQIPRVPAECKNCPCDAAESQPGRKPYLLRNERCRQSDASKVFTTTQTPPCTTVFDYFDRNRNQGKQESGHKWLGCMLLAAGS